MDGSTVEDANACTQQFHARRDRSFPTGGLLVVDRNGSIRGVIAAGGVGRQEPVGTLQSPLPMNCGELREVTAPIRRWMPLTESLVAPAAWGALLRRVALAVPATVGDMFTHIVGGQHRRRSWDVGLDHLRLSARLSVWSYSSTTRTASWHWSPVVAGLATAAGLLFVRLPLQHHGHPVLIMGLGDGHGISGVSPDGFLGCWRTARDGRTDGTMTLPQCAMEPRTRSGLARAAISGVRSCYAHRQSPRPYRRCPGGPGVLDSPFYGIYTMLLALFVYRNCWPWTPTRRRSVGAAFYSPHASQVPVPWSSACCSATFPSGRPS